MEDKTGPSSELELPGFRFHPTEEELLDFYLKGVVYGKKLSFDIIGTLNLYRHDPWELPGTYPHLNEFFVILFFGQHFSTPRLFGCAESEGGENVFPLEFFARVNCVFFLLFLFFIIIYSFVDGSKNFAAVVRLRRKYISLLLIFYGKQFDVSLYYRHISIYIKFLYLID